MGLASAELVWSWSSYTQHCLPNYFFTGLLQCLPFHASRHFCGSSDGDIQIQRCINLKVQGNNSGKVYKKPHENQIRDGKEFKILVIFWKLNLKNKPKTSKECPACPGFLLSVPAIPGALLHFLLLRSPTFGKFRKHWGS